MGWRCDLSRPRPCPCLSLVFPSVSISSCAFHVPGLPLCVCLVPCLPAYVATISSSTHNPNFPLSLRHIIGPVSVVKATLRPLFRRVFLVFLFSKLILVCSLCSRIPACQYLSAASSASLPSTVKSVKLHLPFCLFSATGSTLTPT